MITVSSLNGVSRVRHAFFTRNRGVSTGIYSSANQGFGSDDSPENVAQNRTLAMQELDLKPENLVTLHQIHSAKVVTVAKPWPREENPQADAMVTNKPGIALGILTADCAPVLMADGKVGVVAAAHAGWRGAHDGVLENTITAMEALGAQRQRIVAAIGPCIAQRSYEVGPDFPKPFWQADPGSERFFSSNPRNPTHYMFDLSGYVARRLSQAGLKDVMPTPCDTYREADRFFSYRRATHKNEPDYGRQLSTIVIEP